MREIIAQAKAYLSTLRGETIYMCSSSKKDAIIWNARMQLRRQIQNGLVKPDEIGTTQEELDKLFSNN